MAPTCTQLCWKCSCQVAGDNCASACHRIWRQVEEEGQRLRVVVTVL